MLLCVQIFSEIATYLSFMSFIQISWLYSTISQTATNIYIYIYFVVLVFNSLLYAVYAAVRKLKCTHRLGLYGTHYSVHNRVAVVPC